MSNWTGTLASSTALGMGMAYYALMRRNIELEQQQQQQQEIDQIESSPRDFVGSNDALTITRTETLNHENEDVIKTTESILKCQEEVGELLKCPEVELTEEDVSEAQKLQQEMEVLLQYLNFHKQDEAYVKKNCSIETSTQVPDMVVVEDTNNNNAVTSNAKLNMHKDGGDFDEHVGHSDLEFSDAETFPEPTEPVPVLDSTVQSQSPVDIPPRNIRYEYIPWSSWVLWPFKIFPAKYNTSIVKILFYSLWVICALLAYVFLKCFYSFYKIEKSYMSYHKIGSILSKLNWGQEKQQEASTIFQSTDEWHW